MTSSGRVLVVGDANPDIVLHGDVRPRFGQAEQLVGAELVLGGSGAITASALARLGRPVSLLAAVGDDPFASSVRAALQQAGVDLARLAVRSTTPTGLTVVLSDGPDRAILTAPGAIPSLTSADVAAALAERTDLLHLHVSSFFLLGPLAAALPALLARARDLGLTTSLDTNADPAGRWAGVDALLPHLDLLLPNRSELTALAGDADPATAARRLAAAGPLVVVKDGPAGAWAVAADGPCTHEPGTPVEAVDTTGAGDTFDAAFLDAWLNGASLAGCLARATRAGALAVGALGGTAGQPTADQLDSSTDHEKDR